MCELLKRKTGTSGPGTSETDELIQDLINKMVRINPGERGFAEGLLRHPLFKQHRVKFSKKVYFNRSYCETLKKFTVKDFKEIRDFERDF